MSPSTMSEPGRDPSFVPALRLTAWLLALSLPALLFPHLVREAGDVASTLAAGGEASLRGRMLAYGFAPIVGVSAGVLFLAPGLMLTRHGDAQRTPDRWCVRAIAVSIVIVSLVAAIGQASFGVVFRGAVFGWSIAAAVLALGIVGHRRDRVTAPASGSTEIAPWAVLSLLIPLGVAVLLAPKLHWEAFNGDGAHAFESSRLLLTRPLPFWPEDAGDVAGFPGVTSMLFAFPTSWYLRLFGPIDAAARLPILLYLPLLASALAWCATVARDRMALGTDARSLVWLAVVAYLVAMGWSATYNPYAADLALPATQDTLLVVVFLGFVASLVEEARGWAGAFAVLTYVSLPNGLILIAFWIAALVVAWRPVPWRVVRWTAGLLLALVVGGALLPRLLAALALPMPGREYGVVGILRYFAFLRFTDISRFVWILLPCGIMPLVATLLWARQDRVARALSLVAAAYFLFFFVQANVSLHHFVPSMLLPVAVLWRVIPSEGPARRRWVLATGIAGVAALALVRPLHAGPHLEGRRVGESVWNRVGGYDRSASESFAASSMLERLFPLDWSPSVPAQYGGSPLVWHRYARAVDGPTVNYVLQPSDAPPPASATRIADSAGVSVWVRDTAQWTRDRAMQPPTPAGSPWLAVPRYTLFRSVEAPRDAHVIDVARLLADLGLPMDAILQRLGAPR